MKPSGIITLTTDFGLRDPYVAMMKGVILSINPEARIIDITHGIPPGAIFQAARIMAEAVPYFAKGSVHVAVVDPGVGGERLPVAVETDDGFFVGPDNGIFWPVVKKNKAFRAAHLTEKRFFLPYVSNTFHGRDIFAPVAAYITLGHDMGKMGLEITSLVKLQIPRPKTVRGVMYGEVVRADNFGNLITNIHREDMERFLQSAVPRISIGNLTIREVRHIYASVSEGEPLAIYDSSHYLEIAVNAGKVSDLLGLRESEVIGMEITVENDI